MSRGGNHAVERTVSAPLTAVVGHDARTLFEKAWIHGMNHGLLSQAKQNEIRRDGALAIKKIAGVLGSDHLRADLDRGMQSMLGLVNIHLEHLSGGDVGKAAALLAKDRLLAHTRGANRLLKQLLAETHGTGTPEQSIEQWVVSDWALRPYADISALEREVKHKRQVLAMWRWMARELEYPDPTRFEDDVSGEVELALCTGLLILCYAKSKRWITSLAAFQKLLADIRKTGKLPKGLPAGIPAEHRAIAGELWLGFLDRPLSLILDKDKPISQLASGALDVDSLSIYLMVPGDDFESIAENEGQTTGHWATITGGKMDSESLMALMLCAVYGFALKTQLTPSQVKALAGRLEEQSPQAVLHTARQHHEYPLVPRVLSQWLNINVPHQYHEDMQRQWSEFADELAECSDKTDTIRSWTRVKTGGRAKSPTTK